MLNEVPSTNDVTCIPNIMSNKAPNSNDATCVASNVCLTTMGTQQLSMMAIKPSCRKVDLSQMRDNDTIKRKVHADGNKLCPEKECGIACPVL